MFYFGTKTDNSKNFPIAKFKNNVLKRNKLPKYFQ